MDFQQAMIEYRRLRRAFRAGQISPEIFEKQVNSIVIHYQDHRWMIGVSSGKWYRHDGTRWVEEIPDVLKQSITVPQQVVSSAYQVSEASTVAPAIPVKGKAKGEDRQKRPNFLLIALGVIAAVLVCLIFITAGLMISGAVDVPSQFAVLFPQNFAAEAQPSVVNQTSQPSMTPPALSNTPTPSPIPVDITTIIPGEWVSKDSAAIYRFYDESSYVFFDPDEKRFESGSFTILPGNIIQLEAVLWDKNGQNMKYSIGFESENSMQLTPPGEAASIWQRGPAPLSTSRMQDPIVILYELAYRLGWETPDPNCGFDTNDDKTEFRFNCLDQEEGIALTWVDQAKSTNPDRKMERNMLTVHIDHEVEEHFVEQQQYILDQMEPADPFHGLVAYQSFSDLGWFTIEQFAWFDEPWVYSIFRVSSVNSPFPPSEILFTAETLYEITQGDPPFSSPATIPTERPEGGYQYSKEIIGTWEQRHPSKEILVFAEDMSVQVSSIPGNYSYSGPYFFNDDQHITLELNVGTVYAGVQIEGEVLTLTIEGVESNYDRVE